MELIEVDGLDAQGAQRCLKLLAHARSREVLRSVQEAIGNLFESCSGNQNGSGTAFTPPYEYKSFMVPASEVKALVQKYAGATLGSPTSCE